MAALKLALKVCIATVLLVSSLNFFSYQHWLLELNTSFNFYYFIFHLLSLPVIFFWWYRRKERFGTFCLALSVLLLAYYVISALPFYFAPKPHGTPSGLAGGEFQLLSLHYDGDSVSKTQDLKELVTESAPDLVVMSSSGDAKHVLEYLTGLYRHNLIKTDRSKIKLAIFSDYPLREIDFTFFDSNLPPVVKVDVEINDRTLLLAALSLRSMTSAQNLSDNLLLLRRVVTNLKHQDRAVLFADLGTTPFSGQYQRIISGGKFADVRYGWGLLSLGDCPWPCLPFSHLMAKGDLEVIITEIVRPSSWQHPMQFSRLRFILSNHNSTTNSGDEKVN